MRLRGPDEQPLTDEFDVVCRALDLKDARVLELGCGAAEKTRQIASGGADEVVAAEVDATQHAKNLQADVPANVVFKAYGAEHIEEEDASFDAVVMFKSLHHVPVQDMQRAMAEIARVLKPGGRAYISEPVFEGDFNEVIRLFHDEEAVRSAAFEAVCESVEQGVFALKEQIFFRNRVRLEAFEQFERGILNATHTDHQLTQALYEQVRAKFESFKSDQGFVFDVPNRVDLLEKPAA